MLTEKKSLPGAQLSCFSQNSFKKFSLAASEEIAQCQAGVRGGSCGLPHSTYCVHLKQDGEILFYFFYIVIYSLQESTEVVL